MENTKSVFCLSLVQRNSVTDFEESRRICLIPRKTLTIGRSSRAYKDGWSHIQLIDNRCLSKYQALLKQEPDPASPSSDRWIIFDGIPGVGKSTNGFKINGRPIEDSHVLSVGDEIVFISNSTQFVGIKLIAIETDANNKNGIDDDTLSCETYLVTATDDNSIPEKLRVVDPAEQELRVRLLEMEGRLQALIPEIQLARRRDVKHEQILRDLARRNREQARQAKKILWIVSGIVCVLGVLFVMIGLTVGGMDDHDAATFLQAVVKVGGAILAIAGTAAAGHEISRSSSGSSEPSDSRGTAPSLQSRTWETDDEGDADQTVGL